MTNYFAAVYLSHSDEPAEAAEQVMRATAGVIQASGRLDTQPLLTEADTGSDSPGVVVSTAELTPAQATQLWNAYPYDEETLETWEEKGWKAVSGE
jgi:hypothetical protein